MANNNTWILFNRDIFISGFPFAKFLRQNTQLFDFVVCAKNMHCAQSFANLISHKIALFHFRVILFCAILRKKLSLKGIEIWWLWVVYISPRLWYFNYLHSTWSSQQLKYQMLPPHKNFQFFIYFIFVPQFKVFVTKSNQFRVT